MATLNWSDHLDGARDLLIDEALRICPERVDAVSILVTAGFTILADTIGMPNAVGALKEIVDAVASRIAN